MNFNCVSAYKNSLNFIADIAKKEKIFDFIYRVQDIMNKRNQACKEQTGNLSNVYIHIFVSLLESSSRRSTIVSVYISSPPHPEAYNLNSSKIFVCICLCCSYPGTNSINILPPLLHTARHTLDSHRTNI